MRAKRALPPSQFVHHHFEEIVQDGEDPRRGLERALILHEIGQLFIERNTAHAVALPANQSLDVGLVFDVRIARGERMAELAHGLAKKAGEGAVNLISAGS